MAVSTHRNPKTDVEFLIRGIRKHLLKPSRRASSSLALPEQPFDQQLIVESPLYRRSRELYLKSGGRFLATLVSSPRTLSSEILLSPFIEYSPIEREMIWAATDPKQKKNPESLLFLRTFSSSLFHEQNHRILWQFLPPPPSERNALRRYLNFAESLIIVTDMALGDELKPDWARLFYLAGVTYDPGTTLRREHLSKRQIRNFLQAALCATFLYLEHFSTSGINRSVHALFPNQGDLTERALKRSLKLDRNFVYLTNPIWQERFAKSAVKNLKKKGQTPLKFSSNPLENHLQYLYAEKWFDLLRI